MRSLRDINLNKTNDLLNLNLKNISFSWPSGKKALDNCNLSISGTGLWMIVGNNGSGKSTLLRLISGMIKPDCGQIYCTYKSSFMFQNPDHHLLLPTCQSDLLLSMPHELTASQRKERITNALNQVGLEGMEYRPIHTLSGGQKQKLALAGALISESNLLLLDEPTALLDPESQLNILEIVYELSHRENAPITALWITHRLEELRFCDAAARMIEGRLQKWQKGYLLKNFLETLAVRRG